MKFHKQGFRLRGFPRAFGARAMFHLKKKYVCKIARAALPAGTTLTVRSLLQVLLYRQSATHFVYGNPDFNWALSCIERLLQ